MRYFHIRRLCYNVVNSPLKNVSTMQEAYLALLSCHLNYNSLTKNGCVKKVAIFIWVRCVLQDDSYYSYTFINETWARGGHLYRDIWANFITLPCLQTLFLPHAENTLVRHDHKVQSKENKAGNHHGYEGNSVHGDAVPWAKLNKNGNCNVIGWSCQIMSGRAEFFVSIANTSFTELT